MDSHSHNFLTSHLHTAATSGGGGDVMVAIAVVVGSSLFFLAMAWLLRGADDSDGGPEGGGGGSGPSGPSSPPSPSWWPDFEREFARYAAGRAARRGRSPKLVRAAPRERAPAAPES